MPNPQASSQMRSGLHSVKYRVQSGHGGSGSPVRISAGVRASEPASLSETGVAVRASAAATPEARPMNASSATTSHQKLPSSGCPGARHPPDQEPSLGRTEQSEGDERGDLHEHEAAVGRGELVPGADAQRGARIPRERDDDEADEGDRRVARDDDGQSVGAELALQQHDRDQPAEPHRREDEVQAERRDRGGVPGGSGGVPLLRQRHERCDREHRDEGERRVVAHREAEHRDRRRDERRREPGLPELDRRDELAELLAEQVAEVERLAGHEQEREEARRRARDRHHGSGCRGHVEREIELALLRG